MEQRTLDEKIRDVILTVYHNAHPGDRDKLAAWATKKLKEIMAEHAQELGKAAEKDEENP